RARAPPATAGRVRRRPGPSSALALAPMIHGRVTGALAALGISVVLVACGGGSSEERAPEPQPQPTARAEEFPSADGRSLQEVIQGMEQGLELAPSVSVLDKGVNRYGFVLI